MYGGAVVANEDDWQAEDDARTIARAEAIKADPERMKKAMEAAKRIAERERIEKEAMQKLADAKMDYSKSPHP